MVEGKKFPVNRRTLSAQSEFFSNLFDATEFIGDKEITVEAPLEAFNTIMEYYHVHDVALDGKNFDELVAVLKLSHRFGFLYLRDKLIAEIVSLADFENAWEVRHVAELINSEILMVKFWQLVNANKDRFFAPKELQNLHVDDAYRLLSDSNLNLVTIKKFGIIQKWTNEAEREKLVGAIDLDRLSKRQILEVVRPAGLFDDHHLLHIVNERTKDVKEEIDPADIVPLSFTNLEIIGTDSDQLFSPPALSMINTEIALKMDPIRMNYVEFNVGREVTSFTVELTFSGDSKLFSRSSAGTQKFYFEEIEVTEIHLRGVRCCNSFKALNFDYSGLGTPHLTTGLLQPRIDVITSEFAVIRGKACELLNDVPSNGYTEIPEGGVEIRFHQPFVFYDFHIRLWDLDGRKQSFTVHRVNEEDNRLGQIKEVHDGSGCVRWTTCCHARGFLIVPQKTNPGKCLRVVKFHAAHNLS